MKWRTEKCEINRYCIVKEGSRVIAVDVWSENATQIVHEHNCFEELVYACERVSKKIKNFIVNEKIWPEGEDYSLLENCDHIIKQALSNAKRKETL